jgi:hypothetical protein
MSAQRLHDKYKSNTLQPDQVSHADLISLMAANGASGAIFHVLAHTPSQLEDIYAILIDDRLVAAFEVPRTAGALTAEEFCITPLAQYRNELGQGKSRITLDRAVEDARKLLKK